MTSTVHSTDQRWDLTNEAPVPPQQPVFTSDPVLDAVAHVVFEIAAELWTVKNRLRLVESVLEEEGRSISEVLEGKYAQNPSLIRDDEGRDRFVERVFGAFLEAAHRDPVP